MCTVCTVCTARTVCTVLCSLVALLADYYNYCIYGRAQARSIGKVVMDTCAGYAEWCALDKGIMTATILVLYFTVHAIGYSNEE